MLKFGLSNDIFDILTFVPIVKNMKSSKSDSDNYRAIAISSTMCKILDITIMDFFHNFLSSSPYQFAYKKSLSTQTCSFIAMEIIQYYKNRDSNVIVGLLDCSKAFDRVDYLKLFKLLFEFNVCPFLIRLLIVIYLNLKAKSFIASSIN